MHILKFLGVKKKKREKSHLISSKKFGINNIIILKQIENLPTFGY